jgi:hypothetical protein
LNAGAARSSTVLRYTNWYVPPSFSRTFEPETAGFAGEALGESEASLVSASSFSSNSGRSAGGTKTAIRARAA